MISYILIVFFETIPDVTKFDVEVFVPHYELVSKVISVFLGATIFFLMLRIKKSSEFLNEVYSELSKVMWPEAPLTSKHTIGVLIGVTIVGFLLGFFDFSARFLLNLAK